ncbi:hypothetical protein [Plantactinospora sp. KBS50]|uniref:hypothetical protein n=1 Tax=Plantactinospora sp. KBS50 TaxID=2024580 RepID=UPI0012FE5566|nr:hypothetical protein [Plantactinospora sp. KBS50]
MLMGGSLDDTVERLARLVGVATGDMSDEHARWAIYLKGMELPAARELLLRAVDAESDDNLAASVVLRMIERIGEAERAEWVNSLRGDKRTYAHRRALELTILERILSGTLESAEVVQQIDGWTDWLQLRIAESATSPEVLEIVGEAGRNRRIRKTAKDRRA